MSFLDRFKRKESDEQAPLGASEPKADVRSEPKPEPAAAAPARKLDPANQIAAAAVASGYNPDFKFPAKKERESVSSASSSTGTPGELQHEVILELNDFLPRIPTQMLTPGEHNGQTPLTFDISELADRIARGQTTIPLAEIYRRVPTIFRSEVLESDSAEIRFPWQKVMKLLGDTKTGQAGRNLTQAAADSLAQKLRSRRAVRNIIPGSQAEAGTGVPAPAAAAPAASSAPIPKPELNIPVASAEEDEKMSKEEALKARDTLRTMLARIKGEYERALSAGDQQRRTLADEREKMVVELIRAKKEAEDKNEQVDFEKSVATKSTESLSKAQQERDALKLEISNLKVELGKSQQNVDYRIKELAAERDALALQQATLAKQLSEAQKRGKTGISAEVAGAAGAAVAGAALTAGAGDRSQKDQRQIEELQRRIGILETGQRESAQELSREKEAKVKIERQLAAADRLQQESLGKLQDTQTNLQKEHEAATRKRESESVKAFKDLQDQAAAIAAANTKLSAELDEARKKIAAAPAPEAWESRIGAQFEADIESYRTRIKVLLKEKGDLSNEQKKLAADLAKAAEEKEALTKAQAEALAKVEALAKTQSEALAKAQAEAKPGAAATAPAAELTALQKQIKDLQAERDSLAAKVKSLDEKLGATSTTTVAAAAAAAALTAKLTGEKDSLAADLAKAKAELTAATAKHQEDSTRLKDQHAAALTEKQTALQKLESTAGPTATEVAKLRTELETARTSSNSVIADLRAESKKAQTERDTVAKERETLAAELKKLQDEQQKAKAKLESDLAAARTAQEASTKTVQELQATQEKAKTEKQALDAELAKLRTTHETATSSAVAAKETQEKSLTALKVEHDVLQEKFTTAGKETETLRAQIAQLQTHRETLTAEEKAARSSLEKSLTEITRQRDELLSKVETQAGDLAAAKQEHGLAFATLDKDRDALRAAKEALSAEFASARNVHEKTIAEVHAKHDTLQSLAGDLEQQLSDARHQIAALQEDLQKTKAALGESQSTVAAREAEARQTVDGHQQALAETAGQHDRAIAAFQAEKDAAIAKLTAEKAALASDVDKRIASLTAEHQAALKALQDEKNKSVADLTAEMTATVAALTADRDKVRDELSNAEHKYPLEIADLIEARNSAQRDSSAVAERLAAKGVETAKKQAELEKALEDLTAERLLLKAELEQARETHKAQAGVFASEFKTVVKQRDDALSLVESERARIAEKAAAFERDRTKLASAEVETKGRWERELARTRREKDSITSQRDSLRDRIEKLVDEQRQMLEDMTTQAAFTAMKHGPGSTTGPHPSAEDAPSDDEPVATPMPKPREPKVKEANVIDITEAEIVAPMQGGEGRLKIPRVRPVIIPPPQVRML